MSGGRGKRKLPAWAKALAALVLVFAVICSAALGLVLSGSHDQVTGEPKIMIILGCQVKPWGPSILLQDRLDRALGYWEEHQDVLIVVSGGQGSDEHISEAQCMFDYLTGHGVPEEQVLKEEKSSNTLQNLQNSVVLLEEQGYDSKDGVMVVSNGFHLARVRMLWRRVCGEAAGLSTLAAPSSHAPSRWKMYLREPLALIKSFLLDW